MNEKIKLMFSIHRYFGPVSRTMGSGSLLLLFLLAGCSLMGRLDRTATSAVAPTPVTALALAVKSTAAVKNTATPIPHATATSTSTAAPVVKARPSQPAIIDSQPLAQVEAGSAVSSVAFHPSGNMLAVGSGQACYLWDVDKKQILRTLERKPGTVVTAWVAFSPDGQWLATGGGGDLDKPIVQLWDAGGEQLLRTFDGPLDYVYTIAFSRDGCLLAVGGGPQENIVKLYDVAGCEGHKAGDLLYTLWHNRFVLSTAFNPAAHLLASAGGDTATRIWDTRSGEERFTLTGPLDNVTGVAWAPDGSKLVMVSLDGTLRVWEPSSSRNMQVLGEPGAESLSSVAWSPDGKVIAAGGDNGTLFLWDANTGQLVEHISQAHTATISSLAFNPTGSWLVSGGADGTVKIWLVH